jgi:hypothetical protein
MIGIFITKLVLSFLVGGTWVTIATLIADRYGTKPGGLVTGLPSTILFSLFFIGWTQSPSVAVEATTIVPIIGAVNALFLVAYIFLVRTNFWLALFGSLFIWTAISFTLVLLRFDNFALSLIIYVILVLISYFIIEKGIRVKSETAQKAKNTFATLIFRGLLSGFIVALAVVMGRIGGPLLGGMFAVFPATFLGTLLITYFSHGSLFSSAVMKVALLSAVSVVLYGVIVRYTYIPFGLWWGTLVSFIISFSAAYSIHILVVKRIS